MALHQFANNFFYLLGCEKSASELEAQLEIEWRERWASDGNDVSSSNALNCPKRFNLLVLPQASILPSALEDNLPMKWSKLRSAAARVDFEMAQQKLVGGQSFPRRKHPERKTVVPTLSFPEDKTKAMLKKCSTLR